LKKRRAKTGVRIPGLGGTRQGINRGLRGRGGLITFLAAVGVLGIVSGFALAAPGGNGGLAVKAHPAHKSLSSAAGEEVTTTVTGPDTTLTTTIPCVEQAQREVTPPSTITSTGADTTITETLPGSTETITEPDSTETITQDGTTETVTQPGSTITQTEPGSTVVRTVPGPEAVTTVPGTTETVTDCTSSTATSTDPGTTSTGVVLAASASGVTRKLPIEKSSGEGRKKGGPSDPVATTATGASGSLPFTGLQVPLLILVGLGLGAAGLALRRKAGSLD
jgi:hypothetical protein